MRTNIYIQKKNEELWEMVENKSQFVNSALENQKKYFLKKSPSQAKELEVRQAVANLEVEAKIMTARNSGMEFCKHNAVKGLCKKGCK